MQGAKQVFERNAESLISQIRQNLASTNANATGKTRDSLEYTATDDRLQVKGDKSYDFVEVGRGAGKMPPVKPIMEWATARGLITSPSQGRSLVFLVRRSIAESGTKTMSREHPRDIWTRIVDDRAIDSIVGQIHELSLSKMLDDLNILWANK